MWSQPNQPPATWDAIVQRAELRNGTVELSIDPAYHDRVGDATTHFWVRLIAVDQATGHWLVERPPAHSGRASIRPGMHLVGVMGEAAVRLGFSTRVLAVEKHRLNDEKTIAALRLASPTEVRSAQRRAFYRVAMDGKAQTAATVWPLLDRESARKAEAEVQKLHKAGEAPTPGGKRPRPQVGRPIPGYLHDISGNGVAVRFTDEADFEQLTLNDRYWIEFTLPDQAEPLAAVAQCMRREADEAGGGQAGLALRFLSDAHEKLITDAICRFAAAEQRRQLQLQR